MTTHQSRRRARSQPFLAVLALSLDVAPSQQALANPLFKCTLIPFTAQEMQGHSMVF